MLASASDAIIIGFNVRPAGNARQLADKEEIDIRYYSIIYAAIDDLKDAMEGMLAPEMKEEVLGTAEIREIFKISKVGSIAGSMVMDGKITKNAKIRIVREGVVIFEGELLALKRFKDDVKEVAKGYDCGIQVKGFNDIEERDIIEAYHEVAIKKKLKQYYIIQTKTPQLFEAFFVFNSCIFLICYFEGLINNMFLYFF